MEKHIVIVGGGPAGVITALTAKKVYPEKTVCLIKLKFLFQEDINMQQSQYIIL